MLMLASALGGTPAEMDEETPVEVEMRRREVRVGDRLRPYGYKRVHVQDGPKKRPKLELNPPADAVVRRIFDMALQGKSTLDIAKTLNAEGIPTSNGKKWLMTTVHFVLTNEAYAGTVV